MTPVDIASRAATPRVVLDTNVCLDLFVFASALSAPLLARLHAGTLQAVTRDDCRAEWHRVLAYPVLALDAPRRGEVAMAYDSLVIDIATRQDTPATRLPRCRDPDDQKFLELARDAGAIALVTRDAELLALARRTQRAGLFVIAPPQHLDAALQAWRPVA